MTKHPITDAIRKHADELRKRGVEEARVQHYLKMMAEGREGLAHKIIHKKICGARTHKPGNPPCLCKPLENGRCKWHGGMSTGAKTPEGKARQREGHRRWLERQPWFKVRAQKEYKRIADQVFGDDD